MSPRNGKKKKVYAQGGPQQSARPEQAFSPRTNDRRQSTGGVAFTISSRRGEKRLPEHSPPGQAALKKDPVPSTSDISISETLSQLDTHVSGNIVFVTPEEAGSEAIVEVVDLDTSVSSDAEITVTMSAPAPNNTPPAATLTTTVAASVSVTTVNSSTPAPLLPLSVTANPVYGNLAAGGVPTAVCLAGSIPSVVPPHAAPPPISSLQQYPNLNPAQHVMSGIPGAVAAATPPVFPANTAAPTVTAAATSIPAQQQATTLTPEQQTDAAVHMCLSQIQAAIDRISPEAKAPLTEAIGLFGNFLSQALPVFNTAVQTQIAPLVAQVAQNTDAVRYAIDTANQTKAHCEWLQSDNCSLWMNQERLEQQNRKGSLKIIGCPINPREPTNPTVIDVADKCGVDIDDKDISTSHPLPTRQGAAPTLIVQFTRIDTAHEILKNKRNLAADLPNVKVFESLTAPRMALLRKLRENARVDAAWTWDGKVCIKVRKDGRPVENKQSVRPGERAPFMDRAARDARDAEQNLGRFTVNHFRDMYQLVKNYNWPIDEVNHIVSYCRDFSLGTGSG